MRLVFCGTPAFAVPSLRRLATEPDFEVAAVITQPDRPKGRGREAASPAVKEYALAAGLPIFQPEKIRSAAAAEFLARTAPDAVVIIAYGQIIPKGLLEIPRYGWINVHASLLPRYRGAAPINWAILNGETRSGLTTMRIDAGLDTGPMLERVEMAIGDDETAPQLAGRMAETAPALIVSTLRKLKRNEVSPVAQDNSQATLAPPLKKENGLIDWGLPARQIYNRMRGLQPWPGAYTRFRGQLCHLWGRWTCAPLPPDQAGAWADSGGGGKEAPGWASLGQRVLAPGELHASAGGVFAGCGSGTQLELTEMQLEGRKRISARDFVNGARLQPGERFSR